MAFQAALADGYRIKLTKPSPTELSILIGKPDGEITVGYGSNLIEAFKDAEDKLGTDYLKQASAELGRRGGQQTSENKAKTAKENGNKAKKRKAPIKRFPGGIPVD